MSGMTLFGEGYFRETYRMTHILSLGRECEIIQIGSVSVPADNVQITGYPMMNRELSKEPFPVYFELEGLMYHYVVAAYENRLEVDVCRRGTYKVLSTTTLGRNTPRHVPGIDALMSMILGDVEDLLDAR
jgi:hypothetical protein